MGILAIASGIVSGVGAIIGGINEKNSGDFEAKQLEQRAAEERAGASREAELKRHETTIAESRVQAVAAASGGGAGVDAPTVVNISEGIAKRGEYNALTELWGGESRARGDEMTATSRRASGRNALTAGFINAGSSVLSGVSRSKGYG